MWRGVEVVYWAVWLPAFGGSLSLWAEAEAETISWACTYYSLMKSRLMARFSQLWLARKHLDLGG